MDTRSEMETELVAQLQVAANSSRYPSTRITTLIQNAYKWATNLFIWTDLVKAKTTDTGASQEYYDYPEEFRSNTIVRLEIDGDPYERKNFEDFLDYKENNSTTTKKMFANYGRLFFVNPIPSAIGTDNICAWGAIQADALSSAASETIFTDNNPEGNEAVVQRALGVALKRIDKDQSLLEIQEAVATLAKLHSDEIKATQRDKRLDHPSMNVPNMYGNYASNPNPGRFNYQP